MADKRTTEDEAVATLSDGMTALIAVTRSSIVVGVSVLWTVVADS